MATFQTRLNITVGLLATTSTNQGGRHPPSGACRMSTTTPYRNNVPVANRCLQMKSVDRVGEVCR